MADALVGLVTREDTDQDGDGRVRGPRLLLIADYDVVSRELGNGRLGDGTPVPVQKVRDLACQSDILPAIFRGVSQPLDLGRARRIASPAQRVALVARDKACVGCGATANGVRRITLSPGRWEAEPTWTTCVSFAHDATTASTTTDGKYANRHPGSTTSDHH